MEARELRIGNLVSTPYAEVYECDSFAINHVAYGKLSVNPILLTEEWLLKFGFSKRENSVSCSYYIGENKITQDWLFDIIWLEKPELIGLPNAPFYRNGRHTIYYVHQLQNLYFALTGEELTIKQS